MTDQEKAARYDELREKAERLAALLQTERKERYRRQTAEDNYRRRIEALEQERDGFMLNADAVLQERLREATMRNERFWVALKKTAAAFHVLAEPLRELGLVPEDSQ